jgi:hypothetical protein
VQVDGAMRRATGTAGGLHQLQMLWAMESRAADARAIWSCRRQMNSSRDVLDGGHPGQINWVYDRAEIIADGVVHVIGVCLGILGAVTIVVIAVRRQGTEVVPILVYVVGPAPNARALSCLQHVAGLACQVGSTALRPLRDLFVDRRNLHAFPSPDEKRSGFSGSRPRSLAERGHWYGSQTRTSRSVRPLGDRALLAARVERCHCLRYACICPAERELMASRDWRHSLLTWGRLSYLAAPTLS